MSIIASIVIRTYNEEKWLGRLLKAVPEQDIAQDKLETLIVDSGSTDNTLGIASRHHCRVIQIPKSEFTFGRSLNVGCAAAIGRNLVFISGHCVPVDSTWLRRLIAPLEKGDAHYVYGRQYAYSTMRFSEGQILAKYFPSLRATAQGGFFCNNANAAIRADVWAEHKFDEELTGLEDMELAKRLLGRGYKIDYVPESGVFHIHDETWRQVRLRYERESIALQRIMPEVHLQLLDIFRYFIGAVLHDSREALNQGRFLSQAAGIFMFRLMQYWGSYRGNNNHRRISRQIKERYFYPR